MPAYKTENGMWYVSFYFKDISGKNVKKKKTGFATKKTALNWERQFIQVHSGTLNMNFESFVKLYLDDVKPRLKYTTWLTKERIITLKIEPYFCKRDIADITAPDIIKWQNTIMGETNQKGEPYSETYLRTIQNQMSAIFNHAVKFYGLPENPVKRAGRIGREKAKPMQIWTQEEYYRFSNAIKDHPYSYYAFEILYWCGLRIGELMALTGADVDFDKRTITVNKSYHRIHGKDYITTPKTEKSNRVISMPEFLCDELKLYIKKNRKSYRPSKRLFTMSHNYLHTEMTRGANLAGVKRIRIHDLRHSHVSLLISMGFSAVDIAERLGHESIDITLHYAHMFPTRQTEMADRLESAYQQATCF